MRRNRAEDSYYQLPEICRLRLLRTLYRVRHVCIAQIASGHLRVFYKRLAFINDSKCT